MSDSTSVNLYKLASAALDAAGDARAIVTDRENFSTDRYVLDGVARARGAELRLHRHRSRGGPATRGRGPGAARPATSALVSLSHVAYYSGGAGRHGDDHPRVPGCRCCGTCRIPWGSCRSSWRNGGWSWRWAAPTSTSTPAPGSPAFLYVRREMQDRLRSPIQGWFGQRNQFDMESPYDPEPGVAGLSRRDAAHPRPDRGPGGRGAGARRGDRVAAQEGGGAHRAHGRPVRRVAGAARLRAGLTPGLGAPRCSRDAAPRRGVADHARADRAGAG